MKNEGGVSICINLNVVISAAVETRYAGKAAGRGYVWKMNL